MFPDFKFSRGWEHSANLDCIFFSFELLVISQQWVEERLAAFKLLQR